jgi:radical SAM protein with 4Fe4S-binding SPASM domain
MRFSSANAGPPASANSATNRSRSAFTRTGRSSRSITLIPGSLKRALDAIRFPKSQGLKVILANVLMTQNKQDYPGVHAPAAELGAECTLDPAIPPRMEGNCSTVELGVHPRALRQGDPSLMGDADEFCAIPAKAGESELESIPCGAGHTACYVSPPGDVFPCVQFPLPTGNVGPQPFVGICHHSGQTNEVRSLPLRDLTTCTSCSRLGSCARCPGLA